MKKGFSQTVSLVVAITCLAHWVGASSSTAVHSSRSSGTAVAVVNDQPILNADVDTRIEIAILSSGMERNQATRDYLRPQILKLMVSEELQLQKTREYDIVPSEMEVAHAVEMIEQRNGMEKGELKKKFNENNINFAVMEKHIRASIAWQEYIRSRFSHLTQVTEDEIDRQEMEIKNGKKENQVMLAEIFLPFDSAESEEKVRRNAQEMANRIRNGASFPALAQDFSAAPSAARGGDIGWFAVSRLDPILRDAVNQTDTGSICQPVRTDKGYYILLVRERSAAGESIGKDTLITFNQMQIILPSQPTHDDVERAIWRAQSIADSARSCEMMTTLTKSDGKIRVQRINKASVRDLPVELKKILLSLPTQKASKPLLSEMGVLVFMTCEKEEIDPSDPDRDGIRSILMERKLTAIGERELRKLTQSAHITGQK